MGADFATVLARHPRAALQLSGGRDSLACLYLLRPWLDQITVYWLNTGAAYPETLAIMDQVRTMCPHFVEIDGNQPGVVATFGLPSDLVPVSRTAIGVMSVGETDGVLIQDRYSCCARTIMLPVHQRMLADGITLIIRGQKNDDRLKGQYRSGDVVDGIECLYPVEDWTNEQVTAYLREQGAPASRFYEMLNGSPDCMTCSAWWEEGAVKYLKRYHYPQYQEVQRRLDVIKIAVAGHIEAFNEEVNS